MTQIKEVIIMNKQELIALAKELLEEENLDNRTADLQLLRREYNISLAVMKIVSMNKKKQISSSLYLMN